MKQEFTSAYDLSKWVNHEVLFWSWLDSLNHSGDEYGFLNLYDKLRKLGAEIDTALSSSPGDDRIQPQWAEQVTSLYANDQLLESKSPKAQLVESIRKTDLELAFYILAFFHRSLLSFNHPKAFEGALIALLYKKGVRKNVEAERAALQRLREEWLELFTATKKDSEGYKTQIAQLVASSNAFIRSQGTRVDELTELVAKEVEQSKGFRVDLGKSIDAQLSDYAATIDGFVDQSSAKLKDAEAKLDSLLVTYYQHLALKSPVEYWEENRETHRASAKIYLKWLAKAGPICCTVVFAFGWFLIGRDAQPVWGHIVLFGTFAALVVWGLRVLMKLYLSHMHLETSARERVVMAKTYLALMSEGVEVGDKERSIVMESLFRPAATGILKDDGLPTSSVELVTRLLKGEK